MANMPRAERDFKGIWIPKEIWESRQLSTMEKIVFVEIHSLDNEHGCYASNRYFAEFFEVSVRQINKYIASLKKKGFITVTVVNLNERTIHAAGKYARIRDEELKKLEQDRKNLIHKMNLRKRRGDEQNFMGGMN
jgi:hypothetical protein